MDLNLEGRIRCDILVAANRAGKTGAHIGPSLSLVEISLAILSEFSEKTDVFVLSKAHGALGYYATMHQIGMITDNQFETFEQNGGEFPGQPSRTKNNKVDYSSGSLGMGLSYAAGRAWANQDAKVFVILGDGELDEGSNWESAAIIAKQKLTNVVAIVDQNGLQSDGRCDDILDKDLKGMWLSHGWDVIECDGHETEELKKVIHSIDKVKPTVVLAKTVKGRGVSFMENVNEWHHHELKDEQLEGALKEIGERYGLR